VSRRCLPVILMTLLGLVSPARTEDQAQGFVLILNEENDRFIIPATDKHYTQGLHLALLWPDNAVPIALQPLAFLPDFGIANATRKHGFAIGQNIYTPVDTETTSLIVTDRPYAGWLYLGLIRETRGTTGRNVPTLDHLELDLGVVGPAALGGKAQNWFHGLVSERTANGWKHQLNGEPAVLLFGERKWLFWESGGGDALNVQLIPKLALKLGNVETSAKLGAIMRFGHNLPDEFGKIFRERYGWYVFSEVDGRGVLRNEFLDGNVFNHSHDVKKEPGIAELHVGAGVVFKGVEFRYTFNYLTREFQLQDKYDAYGSLDFICRF
jgi:hypothetical protein